MSYEEDLRPCRHCGQPTWHGREVVDVFESGWLAVFSHLITLYNDLLVSWRCVVCGGRSRGRALR
jgi:hypothetical protein